MTAMKKLNAAGTMQFYNGDIVFEGEKRGYREVIRAFQKAAQKIAHSDIIPVTIGAFSPGKVKPGITSFEFCVAADISAPQAKKILAEVKKTTGATISVQ